MTHVSINFHGDLNRILNRKWRGKRTVNYHLKRRASIKDIIEALGIPHTEIDRLIAEEDKKEQLIDLDYIPDHPDNISVFPVSEQTDFFAPNHIRPLPLPKLHFIADVNVGKLAKKLRILGFDTLYGRNFTDDLLAETAARESRILLSKDKGILMRKKVIWGHLVRNDDPEEQLTETVRLFKLHKYAVPFTRCQRCNGKLVPVAKKEIHHLLEPLTKKYYDSFHVCESCGQIYWAGSHRKGMDKKLNYILQT